MEPGRKGRLWMEVASQVVALGAMIWGLKVCLHYIDPYREQREQAKKRAAFLKRHLGRTLDLNEFEQLLAAQVMNPDHIEVSLEDVSGLEHIVDDLETKVLYPMLRPELYCTTLWRQTKGVLLYGPPGTGKTMLAKALAKQSHCFFLNITASSIMSKWLGDANRLVRAVFSLAAKLQPCIIFIDEVDAMLGKRGANQEHEATLQVKTEFMQLWDGMESSRGQRVVVMGATNRPWMVDEAVLRRFTLQYEVGLPNAAQRKAILRGYLRRHAAEVPHSVDPELLADSPTQQQPLPAANGHAATANGDTPAANGADSGAAAERRSTSGGVSKPTGLGGAGLAAAAGGKAAPVKAGRAAAGSTSPTGKSTAPTATAGAAVVQPSPPVSALESIAAATEGFSGSDLLELCAQAAQRVLAEHLHAAVARNEAEVAAAAADADGSLLAPSPPAAALPRPLGRRDLEEALAEVRPSTHKAEEYNRAVSGGGLAGGGWGGGGHGVPMSHADIMQAISLLMQLRGGQ